MALGKIKADTLEHSTAGSLDTQYVVKGSAKSWCNLNGQGTIAQRDSFNHSSTTDDGTGTYIFSLVTHMSNTNYTAPTNCDRNIGTRQGTEGVQYINITSGGYKIECVNAVPNLTDQELVYTQTLGDLA